MRINGEFRPSIVTDPANGRVPALLPAAQQRNSARTAGAASRRRQERRSRDAPRSAVGKAIRSSSKRRTSAPIRVFAAHPSIAKSSSASRECRPSRWCTGFDSRSRRRSRELCGRARQCRKLIALRFETLDHSRRPLEERSRGMAGPLDRLAFVVRRRDRCTHGRP